MPRGEPAQHQRPREAVFPTRRKEGAPRALARTASADSSGDDLMREATQQLPIAYRGRRTSRVPSPSTATSCPLDSRLDMRNHSPTGFEWGYGGSGPAQLALALAASRLPDSGSHGLSAPQASPGREPRPRVAPVIRPPRRLARRAPLGRHCRRPRTSPKHRWRIDSPLMTLFHAL